MLSRFAAKCLKRLDNVPLLSPLQNVAKFLLAVPFKLVSSLTSLVCFHFVEWICRWHFSHAAFFCCISFMRLCVLCLFWHHSRVYSVWPLCVSALTATVCKGGNSNNGAEQPFRQKTLKHRQRSILVNSWVTNAILALAVWTEWKEQLREE